MRTRYVPLIVLGIGCAGDPDTTAPVELPDARMVVVAGLVQDSMLGLPLGGIRVLLGDSSILTDSMGRFATRHRAGTFPLAVNDFRFEDYEALLHLISDEGQVQIQLRGQAPYVTGCVFQTDLVTATVIDLQGRKTINRQGRSTMTFLSSDMSFRRDANTWSWTPVDNFTWLADVRLGGQPADSVVWRLEDADGHARTARCLNQAPPCSSCSAPH